MNETSLFDAASELQRYLRVATGPRPRHESVGDRDFVNSLLTGARVVAIRREKFLDRFEPVRPVVLKATLAVRRAPPKSASNRLELLAKLADSYIGSIDHALWWFASESSLLDLAEWRTEGKAERIAKLQQWFRETKLFLEWGDLIKQLENAWQEADISELPASFELQEEVVAVEIELRKSEQQGIAPKNTSEAVGGLDTLWNPPLGLLSGQAEPSSIGGRNPKDINDHPDEKECIQLWLGGMDYDKIDAMFAREKKLRNGEEWSDRGDGDARGVIKQAKRKKLLEKAEGTIIGWKWKPGVLSEKVSGNVSGHPANS